MNKKKLILLTSQFPYGTGETFLESEIHFLSEAFEEIHIFATVVSSADARAVPDNVKFSKFSEELSKVEKLKALTLASSKDYREEKRRAEDVYGLEWTSKRRNTALVSLFRGRKLAKMLTQFVQGKKEQTVLYSYWCNDSAIGLGLFRRENPEVKAVSRAHGWDLYFEATAFGYQPFRQLIAENLSALLPISDKGKNYILENWKVNPQAIEVSRLGTMKVDHDGKRSEKNILVSCSNMIPLKRVHLIAEALSLVDGIQLEWVHFGDGKERGRVEEALEKLDSDQVNVQLMGRRTNTEILEWFAQNSPDLFINVSTTEGIPVSIMEAMSFGTPVLATYVGGTSEIVNSENGQLLPADLTPELLAERIQDFFQLSEETQNEKRKSALKTWETKYNAATNYARFAKSLIS